MFSVTTGSFNTALGAGSLDLNTADSNTANGAASLLFNTTGIENTARAKDHRGVDLISDALPFGRLWYGEPDAVSNAIGYALH